MSGFGEEKKGRFPPDPLSPGGFKAGQSGRIKFDLFIGLHTLAKDEPGLAEALEADENKVRQLRAQIVAGARKNHILERELQEIDDKIKLLVKNRISVQEVIAHSQGAIQEEKGGPDVSGDLSIASKKTHYEDLFYLLQSKPRYLAKLARLVDAKDTPTFVQTVVFDMYGDQYDTREERLLLSMFKMMLQDELAASNDKGSLLRANTAVTQMLSAYAKRGQGLSVLKGVLEEPLRKITAQKSLNLEINPAKVYSQMIIDYETREGKESPLPKQVDDDTAASHPDVQKIIAERKGKLVTSADVILTRIVNGAESIPYGMRWICRQLSELAKQRFPDIDRHQVGSLMGGYIYLRFFNPIIVTPDAINFVDQKPSRLMRRNLILIAKVLQNLSNGLLFGDKETYMKPLNDFIKDKTEPLQKYFQQLIKVDDLHDALQVDKFLEHTSANILNISLQQIVLIHSLAHHHLDALAKDDSDALRAVLKNLGTPPALGAKDGNRPVALSLSEVRSARMGSAAVDQFVGERTPPLVLQAKKSLLNLLRKLPPAPGKAQHILPYLEDHKAQALAKGDAEMVDGINNAVAMLRTLYGMNLLPKEASEHETFDMFLWTFVQEAMNRRSRIDATKKRLTMIESACETIEAHHKYLLSRLELYKMYLDNVRAGQSQQQAAVAAKNPEKKKLFDKVLKYTHQELEQNGVISQTNAAVKRGVLKKCYYAFSMVSPGRFKVELHLKKGVDIQLLKKPIELNLEDLLQMQEKGQASLEFDYVTLNVSILVHLLNTKFMVHVAK